MEKLGFTEKRLSEGHVVRYHPYVDEIRIFDQQILDLRIQSSLSTSRNEMLNAWLLDLSELSPMEFFDRVKNWRMDMAVGNAMEREQEESYVVVYSELIDKFKKNINGEVELNKVIGMLVSDSISSDLSTNGDLISKFRDWKKS